MGVGGCGRFGGWLREPSGPAGPSAIPAPRDYALRVLCQHYATHPGQHGRHDPPGLFPKLPQQSAGAQCLRASGSSPSLRPAMGESRTDEYYYHGR